MKPVAVGGLLLSFAGGGISHGDSAPGCVIDCIETLFNSTNGLRTVCDALPRQHSLFQCLATSCSTDKYGYALAHTITTCSDFGAHISTLHPVELHHVKRQLVPTAPGPVMLEPYPADDNTRVVNFGQQFAVAIDCNAGSNGVVTLSLPAPAAALTPLPAQTDGPSGGRDPNGATGASEGQSPAPVDTSPPMASQPSSGESPENSSGGPPDAGSGITDPDCDEDRGDITSSASTPTTQDTGEDCDEDESGGSAATPAGDDLDPNCEEDKTASLPDSPPLKTGSYSSYPQASPAVTVGPSQVGSPGSDGPVSGQSSGLGVSDPDSDCDDEDTSSNAGSDEDAPTQTSSSAPTSDPSSSQTASQANQDPDCDPSDASVNESDQPAPSSPVSGITNPSAGQDGSPEQDCDETDSASNPEPATSPPDLSPVGSGDGFDGSGGPSNVAPVGQDDADCDDTDSNHASGSTQGASPVDALSATAGRGNENILPTPAPSVSQMVGPSAGILANPTSDDENCDEDDSNSDTESQIGPDSPTPQPTVAVPPSLPVNTPNSAAGSNNPPLSNGQRQSSPIASGPSAYSPLSDWLAGLSGSSSDNTGNACSGDASQCSNDNGMSDSVAASTGPPSASSGDGSGIAHAGNSQRQGNGSPSGAVTVPTAYNQAYPSTTQAATPDLSNSGGDPSWSVPGAAGDEGGSDNGCDSEPGDDTDAMPSTLPTVSSTGQNRPASSDSMPSSGNPSDGSPSGHGDFSNEPCDDDSLFPGDTSGPTNDGAGNLSSQVGAATLWPSASGAAASTTGLALTPGSAANGGGNSPSQAPEATSWTPNDSVVLLVPTKASDIAPTAAQQLSSFVTAGRPITVDPNSGDAPPTDFVGVPGFPTAAKSTGISEGNPDIVVVTVIQPYSAVSSPGSALPAPQTTSAAASGPQSPVEDQGYSPLEYQAYSRRKARDLGSRHEEASDSRAESGYGEAAFASTSATAAINTTVLRSGNTATETTI